MRQTLLVAPAGHQVGLTSVALGLIRALDRLGVRIAFCKPIAQPVVGEQVDRSLALIAMATLRLPPPAMAMAEAETLLSAGEDQVLMERVVAVADQAGACDVLVVEALVGASDMFYAARVNNLMAKALDAQVVLVGIPGGREPAAAAEAIAIAGRAFGDGRIAGAVLNRVAHRRVHARGFADAYGGVLALESAPLLADAERERLASALRDEGQRCLAIIADDPRFSAPRVLDLVNALPARVLRAGDLQRRRIHQIALGASTVPNAVPAMTAGTLLIIPGDRQDLLVAASLAALTGTHLAAVLLTGGREPDVSVLKLCEPALATGLPLLAVDLGAFAAATAVNDLDRSIAADDTERVDMVATAIADRFDRTFLESLARNEREPRLSPPAFRHRLITQAQSSHRRIVLPEGDEPRTLAAAAICHQRGIARCVLLGDPALIRSSAARAGVALPEGIEIVDASAAAPRYLESLVAARKHKGMTPAIAASELGDTIMVATMMLHLGEVDGLVSGAVHTTAHTIRPALQIIKTAPGVSLVSSIFFMCLPDQVLVFGDCAVNPDPNAEQLADIAIQSADSAIAFGIPARVAILSYSTGESGTGVDVEKVREATALAKKLRPDLLIDGPLQYDAAVNPEVGRSKAPNSLVAGRATVLIFPDLNTGNVTYKAVQRSAGVVSMGPMLQGMAKPVNDLSRGALVEDIVYTIALTAIQAGQGHAGAASAAS
ncbi:phosphate acetyltransferase [Planctomycetota bacterium]|nr:phosphate acetyltransferase [Planctomycetota bacterium]